MIRAALDYEVRSVSLPFPRSAPWLGAGGLLRAETVEPHSQGATSSTGFSDDGTLEDRRAHDQS